MPLKYLDAFEHLAELRAAAEKKFAEDPIPRGKEAEDRLQKTITELGLESNVVELEVNGYTVLRPKEAAPEGFVDRLRAAVERIIAEQDSSSFIEGSRGLGRAIFHNVRRDPLIEQALVQPRPLALVHYLLGYRAQLSLSTILCKTKGAPGLGLHADHSGKFPTPWPMTPNQGNVTWVLSDYSKENGPVCVVPGSHRIGSGPPPERVDKYDDPSVRLLEVEAGSVIVWHGSLWHGAVPRTAEGRRLTLLFPVVRANIQPQDTYWLSTTREMVERNPASFAALMGLATPKPFAPDGPDAAMSNIGLTSGSRFD